MENKIYVFDNQTGRDIPEKVDNYSIEVLTGSKLSEIHGSIPTKSLMLCVFTKLEDLDFVVPTEKEASALRDILNFGGLNYKVEVKESSIWYSKNVELNLIVSPSADIQSDKLATLLSMYIASLHKEEKKERPREMYIIYNTRSSKIVFKTPDYFEAVEVCDKNPCTVIRVKSGNIIYKSNYGRVKITPVKSQTRKAAFGNIKIQLT